MVTPLLVPLKNVQVVWNARQEQQGGQQVRHVQQVRQKQNMQQVGVDLSPLAQKTCPKDTSEYPPLTWNGYQKSNRLEAWYGQQVPFEPVPLQNP